MQAASTLGELFEAVRKIQRSWTAEAAEEEIWFRGESHLANGLLPTLYRDGLKYSSEDGMFQRFMAWGAPFCDAQSDWSWYFTARHHGLPSRLLDWSESLLVATYFALKCAGNALSKADIENALSRPRLPSVYDGVSPAIWVLEAGSLNCYSGEATDDYPYIPGGEFTEGYLPRSVEERPTEKNEFPIAILPPRKDVRVLAQRGVFTLHGHARMPLDRLVQRSDGRKPPRLESVVLDRANVAWLWDDLSTAGIDQLAMFPDLDSVATVVKESHELSDRSRRNCSLAGEVRGAPLVSRT